MEEGRRAIPTSEVARRNRMEAVAAGETSFPAILHCTKYDICLQCISLPPIPSSPRNSTATQEIGALVELQPCQRDLNSRCHQELRNTAVIPFLSPSSQSVNHNYPLYTKNTPMGLRRSSHSDSTVFRTHSAETWPHGAVNWRESRSWLLSGVYCSITCLCPCQTPLHTMPMLAAAQSSQGIF